MHFWDQIYQIRIYDVLNRSTFPYPNFCCPQRLTDRVLLIDTASNPSPETHLFARHAFPAQSLSAHINQWSRIPVTAFNSQGTLSKLTYFRYYGHSVFLDALVAGLSALSLQDVDLGGTVSHCAPPPIYQEHYHVTFRRFTLSLVAMSSALSTRPATVEELRVAFQVERAAADDWENNISWRRFLQKFPNVKVLRTEGANNSSIARILFQNDEEPDGDIGFLPALEEIELGKNPLSTHENQFGPELALLANKQVTQSKVSSARSWTCHG
jgi:hypothetical protein